VAAILESDSLKRQGPQEFKVAVDDIGVAVEVQCS
jgi:hypothetical protein